MNGYLWRVKIVYPDDPMLVDRTKRATIATTDGQQKIIYLSKSILHNKSFLIKVLLHELSHCVMISYDLTDYIHRMVREDYWIEAEEALCNFIADYGAMIFEAASSVLGYDALRLVPKELERLVA